MKNENQKSKMINRIKYNTCCYSSDGASYFSFEAKWKNEIEVYFKIKSLSEGVHGRHLYNKKGCLSFDNSRYFISLVNSINFIKFRNDSKKANIIVYDGESNVLKVKIDKYCGRIIWDTCYLKSEYIDTINRLVRICKRHKNLRNVLVCE